MKWNVFFVVKSTLAVLKPLLHDPSASVSSNALNKLKWGGQDSFFIIVILFMSAEFFGDAIWNAFQNGGRERGSQMSFFVYGTTNISCG